MIATTSHQMRIWRGPAILSYGFRPFFLGAALWTTIAMILWVPMMSGQLSWPLAFDAVNWHAHEFLFGYLGAVIAGFLLTAVPNWTGRLPIVGWRLGALALLWLAGRLAIAVPGGLPAGLVARIDLAFPMLLALVIGREIVAGRNWRNVIVLAMLAVFIIANALFHWEAATGGHAAQGAGTRLGLAAAIMMIAVIGGRIIPSFTRNWLVKQGSDVRPAPPMQRFDKMALAVLLLALAIWVVWPADAAAGGALAIAGIVHAIRLARWAGHRTLSEPLLSVLHVAYAFLPLGAFGLALSILAPASLAMATAQHLWMAGAIGLMTLAVMTRATLGHTGRAMTAGPWTVLIYTALVLSVLARVVAGLWPELSGLLHVGAGLGWIAAFGGFAVLFGPLLLHRSPPGHD